ncbi:ABC transporter ATP-binding protein [Chondromyces crocatus]|uniref:ABC transporter permease n=1 Tax=Chondromyces crocatus TaxID=52 RepID=A0A0K1EEA8_CHOCO|nr:ABC transporter ATP-binding protein [Chondromyces crocatus]AKT39184.1 ABC transporter permease [Chondromyces crocatus]
MIDPRSAHELRLHLLSSKAGRESWRSNAIQGRWALAPALKRALEARTGVRRASVNAWTGRVVVEFTSQSIEAPVEELLRESLSEILSRGGPEIAVDDDVGALLRVLGKCIEKPEQLLPLTLFSAVGHAARIAQGFSLLSTVTAARGPGSPPRDGVEDARAESNPVRMGMVTLALSAAELFLRHHRTQSWRQIARSAESSLRAQVFEAIVAQDMATRDKQGTGRLIGVVTEDVARIGAFIERGGDTVVSNTLAILVAAKSLLGSPHLVVTAAAPLLLVALPSRHLERRASEARSRRSASSDEFHDLLENSLAGISDIKSHNAETATSRRVAGRAHDLADASTVSARAISLQQVVFEGFFSASFALAAAFGGARVARGKASEEAYTKALYSFPQLVSTMTGVQEVIALYQNAVASARRLLELLDDRPTIRSGPTRLPMDSIRGEIVVEGISFGYEPSRKILDDVSFHLKPGQTLGIVGPTGSGKSTLLRLLLRLYDVDAGRILLDGHDLRDLVLSDTRAAIAIVGQEPYLFRGTVRENVLLGRPGASQEEVRDALRKAEALEFVEALPDGLDADVGERGRRLSGGQRQRVAIARALLKRAPILALDEATSHLDYETEAAVQRAFRDTTAGVSMIVVAHRLATVRHADQIVVLDEGRIRERGRHDELVAHAGLYAYLWQLQNG